MNGGAYVVVQQNPPGDAIGHIVVIVGYDPSLGFKVKLSDENDGRLEWNPENRMTWYQYIVTEEEYEVVMYNFGGFGGVQIGSKNQVVNSFRRAHLNETGEILNTDFDQRNELFLDDFGFVLKFSKK